MEISKLLELFSNDGLTCAKRAEFSKWKVNRLKVEQLIVTKLNNLACTKYLPTCIPQFP